MGKSYWLKNQGGNYSNEKNDTFDESKDYIGIRLQQGVPLLDRDINELEDLRRYQDMNMRRHYVGDGTPDNGFEISKIEADLLDFKIGKGRYLVDGIEAICREEITYKKQTNVPDLNPATGPRKDLVYIELTILEVDGPKNSQDAEVETCKRQQVQWKVLVNENSENLPPADPFKWRTRIALLERDKDAMNIKDLRGHNGGFNRDVGDLNVKGKLTVKNSTELNGSLTIAGDAKAKTFVVDEGATVKTLNVKNETCLNALTATSASLNKLTVAGDAKAKTLVVDEGATVKTLNITDEITLNALTASSAALNTLAVAIDVEVLSSKEYDSDIAKSFPISNIMRQGEVVCFMNGVLGTAREAEDPGVVGVISFKPKILLGKKKEFGEDRYLVTQGVALCRVMKNSTDKIEIGDFLTSAGINQPGAAKKADPKSFKPGSIIGRALEKFDTADTLRTIKILVMRF